MPAGRGLKDLAILGRIGFQRLWTLGGRGLVRPVDGSCRSAGLDGCVFYEVQLSTVLGSSQDSSPVSSHRVSGGEGVLSGSRFDASSSVVCVVLESVAGLVFLDPLDVRSLRLSIVEARAVVAGYLVDGVRSLRSRNGGLRSGQDVM